MGPVPIFFKTLIIVLINVPIPFSKNRCNFSFVFYVYISEIENNDKGDIDEIKNENFNFFDGCYFHFCRI